MKKTNTISGSSKDIDYIISPYPLSAQRPYDYYDNRTWGKIKKFFKYLSKQIDKFCDYLIYK